MKVLLNSVDRIKRFVAIATNCEEDIDLVSGRYLIDAKSIMGIFSLDVSRPIEIHVHSDDAESVIKKFGDFIV